MRQLSLILVFVGVVGFINHYLGSPLTFHGPDLTRGQIKIAYAMCAQENAFEVVPIEELSTQNRNFLLGCALESGSYNFVRWALQSPKEMLSIESKFNSHWPVESVARWENGSAAVDTLKLILEPNDALWKVKSSAPLMVALYEASTVDAAEYLAEKYNYLLPEDNQQLFAREDYPKYLGLTLAQYHAFRGRIDVAEYFASKGSRVAIPGMNFRHWILDHDKEKKRFDDKLDAFLSKHGVPRDNSEEIAAAPTQSVLTPSAHTPKFPSTTGWPLPLGDSGRVLWMEGNTAQRWDPSTNELKDKFELPFPPESAIGTAQGIVFVAGGSVAAVTPSGKVYSGSLTLTRSKQRVVVLADQSVLVASGDKVLNNMVERIVFHPDAEIGDALSVERMPDLPGEVRKAFSIVALADGRAMVLGGTDSPYVGCSPCTAETWFLNPKSKTWSAGPKMNEARSDMSATLLPDGSVLVAGGWTPKNTWSDAPARTTERWDPRSNGFVSDSPLPLGVAKHQAMWLPNRQGKQLLLVGGWVKAWEGNQSVLALDVENGAWRMVGEQCNASGRTGELMAGPFEYNDRHYVWCKDPIELFGPLNLVPLRLGSMGETSFDRFDPDKGIALRRQNMAFLPPHANSPGLAVGGTIDGADTAAVDVVWLDGRIQGIAPLNHARRHAQVFRLRDGSILVAGGKGGDATRRTQHVPPFELLPASEPLEQARWIDIDFDSADIAAMGLLGDGSLLALHSTGNVERLTITVIQNKPAVQRSAFPSLNRRRVSSYENGEEVLLQELPDGRIIIAGGSIQYHRMALLHEDAFRADAPDHFVNFGEFTPAHYYEIYDPVTRSWRESAASHGTSSTVAVLDDGRVVKWGRIKSADPWEQRQDSADRGEAALEISSNDGKAWGSLKEHAPPLVATDVVQQAPELFMIDGELFLIGKRPTDVTADHWRGNAMVQWFDTSSARWETLWESGSNDNWRDHVGRIIIRELPNGKRIALPVEGLSGNRSGG